MSKSDVVVCSLINETIGGIGFTQMQQIDNEMWELGTDKWIYGRILWR